MRPYFYGDLYVTSVSVPVIRDGAVLGVAGGDVDLRELCETLAQVKIGDNGFLLFADGSGNIVAHPDRNLWTKNLKDYLAAEAMTRFAECMSRTERFPCVQRSERRRPYTEAFEWSWTCWSTLFAVCFLIPFWPTRAHKLFWQQNFSRVRMGNPRRRQPEPDVLMLPHCWARFQERSCEAGHEVALSASASAACHTADRATALKQAGF